MSRFRGALLGSVLLACLIWLAACGGSTPAHSAQRPGRSRPSASALATWSAFLHVRGVVDLTSPGPGGMIVVAAHGRLDSLGAPGVVRPFAPRYSAPPGLEPYIARGSGQRPAGAACAFPTDDIYALRLAHGDGVTVVDARGGVALLTRLPSRGLEDGIVFDSTGRFGHRLLVTRTAGRRTTMFAIDCRGRVQILTRTAPRVEGGLAVAPASFGPYGGDLIASDEVSGRLYAVAPDGRVSQIARPGIPHGQDVGIESEGFVPAAFKDALVSDRRTPGNPHPGDDLILRVPHATLASAGVAPGDLLIAGEGGAETVDVRCAARCRVTHIADGPPIAHIEGQIVFSSVL